MTAGDLVDGALNVRQDPGHAQGRDDGVGVLDAHHRDAQEVCGGIADRDRLHHGAEIRVQHQPAMAMAMNILVLNLGSEAATITGRK